MNTLDELIQEYEHVSSLHSSGNMYHEKSIEIIKTIKSEQKYKFLKKIMRPDSSNPIDSDLLQYVIARIVNIEINYADTVMWDLWVTIYTLALIYRPKLDIIIALPSFTYTNLDRCKQIYITCIRYGHFLQFDIPDSQLFILDLYPNARKFTDWWKLIKTYNIYEITCILRNTDIFKKLLKSDSKSNLVCTPIKCISKCGQTIASNPEKYPNIYTSEEIEKYKNDDMSNILKNILQPWKPYSNKYWPYSFRVFVKTMLLIYNRNSTNLTKDSLFNIIRMLDRNAFSYIYAIYPDISKCVVCGKPATTRCVTCRKQDITIIYCSTRCIEYDWEDHKKLHI